MSAIWWNCCGGLGSKFHHIREVIQKTSPVVFFVIEAELYKDDANLFCLAGYELILDDDFSRIVAYCKQGEGLKKLKTSKNVLGFDNGKYRIYGLYREFKKPKGITYGQVLKDQLSCILINDKKPSLVGGDFNVDLNKPSGPSGYLHSTLQEWAIDTGLTQRVKELASYSFFLCHLLLLIIINYIFN